MGGKRKMRWIKAKKEHPCCICFGTIQKGDICIESPKEERFYHEECHKDKFCDSWLKIPLNKKPTEE